MDKCIVKLNVPVAKAKEWKDTAQGLGMSRNEYLINLILGENFNDSFLPDERESYFNKFWTQYPRKQSKQQCQKAFNKLSKTQIKMIFNALPTHQKYWEIKGTSKEYIPHPSTWINQRRWEDEIDLTEVQIPSNKKEVKEEPKQLNLFKKVFNTLTLSSK